MANAANVNAAEFFGPADWGVVAGFSQVGPANGQSGSFTIAGADFTAFDYMVVFKDGSGTNLIGFLLNEEANSIDWTSPFTNPPFGDLNENQIKDVSHLSVFQRAGDPPRPVPEPASLGLFGLALLGLGMMRRRFAG